jgi:hypothetical protein
MRGEETDAPGMQRRHKGPRRKTTPTSGEEEDAQRGHQAETRCEDSEVYIRVLHPTMETGGLATVEVLAPAEAEEIAPWRRHRKQLR